MENPFEQFVFGRQSANTGKPAPSLGAVPSTSAAATAAAARKSRAHSRTGSISQFINVPAAPVSAPEQPPLMPRSRPTSTHKRHSSVSNRRESAELMGIALPPEDPTKDNHTVQDPVLRALLALEGNRSSSSSPRNSFINNRFAEVQIPDFDALDAAEAAPEPRMPALSLNFSLAGKRDSFGKLLTPASSINMELGTLIEEEEEEEDVVERAPAPAFLALPRPVSAPPAAPAQTLAAAPAPAFVTPPPPQPLKARPHNLDLRALTVSTAPNVVQPPTSDSSSILTPAATPSPRVTGLKSLTLTSSPLISASPSPLSGGARFGPATGPPANKTLVRKSSISYRRSDDDELSPRSPPGQSIAYGRPSLLSNLLTPEPTPTSGSLPGTPSEMSPSRRTFIYHSHAALVSRVSELERLLATSVSTPVSTTSDEFLALIADLKSERDELKRDAQTFRSRISDLEKQNATLTTRIEKERREGWALREQLGGLQIEKASLESDHKKLKAANDGLQDQVAALQAQLAQMRNERDDARHALEASRSRRTLKPTSHANPGALSIDSLSSATDVESIVSQRSSLIAGLNSKLKVVEEEDDCQFYRSAEQLDLKVPHYEDDSDDSFYSRSRPNSACSITLSIEPEFTTKVNHSRHDTLSRTWNFAKASSAPRNERKTAEVDRFFVCLEDQEDASSIDDDLTMTRPLGGFGGFGGPLDDEDDMPPFVLPTQNEQAKFAALDTDDEEDDGINFVIPSSAPVAPVSKPAPKQSGLQFSFPRRAVNKPSTQGPPRFTPVLKPRSAAGQRW